MADGIEEAEPLQDWLKAMKKNETKLDGMTSALSLANQFVASDTHRLTIFGTFTLKDTETS